MAQNIINHSLQCGRTSGWCDCLSSFCFIHLRLTRSLLSFGPFITALCIVLCILFTDDLAIIACTPEELQQQLDALLVYCNINNLTVNTKKTKLMIFHRVRLPKSNADFQFLFNNQPLEHVSQFCYLGFNFSVQLSFSFHVKQLVSKANRQIGMLYQKVKIRELKLDVVLKLFYSPGHEDSRT